MSDKYRINPDFVVPEPTGANFFCTVSEEEFTPEFQREHFDRWREHGVKQCRVTLVNDEFPESGYPHGVWIEGWTDENARQLPFGESEKPGGAAYPPLVAPPALAAGSGTAETVQLAQCEASQSGPKGNAQ